MSFKKRAAINRHNLRVYMFKCVGNVVTRSDTRNRMKNGLVWTLLKFKSVHSGGR